MIEERERESLNLRLEKKGGIRSSAIGFGHERERERERERV